MTKGRPEISSTSGGNYGKPQSRGHNNGGTISSNKISSTTKPDIIISQENIGPIAEDSSPFPHGSGNIKINNDSGSFYSPYLPLSHDGSPINGGQYSPSSHFISPSITSPFNEVKLKGINSVNLQLQSTIKNNQQNVDHNLTHKKRGKIDQKICLILM